MFVAAFSDMVRCWRLFQRPCKPSTLTACEEGVERCCEVMLRDGSAEVGTLDCLLIGEGVLETKVVSAKRGLGLLP